MPHGTPSVRCTRTAFDEIECALPFRAAPDVSRRLIAEWKDQIPYKFRSFDPSTKVWRFWDKYESAAISLLLRHFPDAEVPFRYQPTSRRTTPPNGDAFATLHLLPTAPRAVVDAAYRALAKQLHPDRGGTDAAMRRLTEAHDALSRRLSA